MVNQNNPQVAARTFSDRAEADRAIRALQAAGFSNDQINVVAKDRSEQSDIADEHHVGAGTGAGIGIVEGAAIGLLAGLGGLLIPGIGALAVAGPIAGLLAGGITGGIAGALAGWGIDAAEAKGYEERVAAGDVLVAVRDDDPSRVAEARRILYEDGGYDTTSPAYDATMATSTATATAMGAAPGAMSTADTTMTGGDKDVRVPVVEEELVAGKRAVEAGRVHLRKDVVEEQQSVSVPVTREEVHVERVPVSGDSSVTATDAFQERDIDVPVMGEEVVVDKRAHVVEEVRLHKDVVQDSKEVSDTVRKERVYVDGDDTENVDTRTTTGRTRNS